MTEGEGKRERPYLVIGAGCLGQVLASALSRTERGCILVVRSPRKSPWSGDEATLSVGIKPTDGAPTGPQWSSLIPTTLPCAGLPSPDNSQPDSDERRLATEDLDTTIFVTTKCSSVTQVVKSLAWLVSATAIAPALSNMRLVLCQNGIGVAQSAKNALPERLHGRVWRMGCWLGARKEVHVVHLNGIHRFVLAASTAKEEQTSKVVRDLSVGFQTLLPTGSPVVKISLGNGISELEWEKTLLNIAFNGVLSIIKQRNGAILESEPLKKCATALTEEALAVARAQNIQFFASTVAQRCVETCLESFARTAENVNSSLQDLLDGHVTEMNWLNGAVSTLGTQLGVPTPCNDFVCNIVEYLDTNKSYTSVPKSRYSLPNPAVASAAVDNSVDNRVTGTAPTGTNAVEEQNEGAIKIIPPKRKRLAFFNSQKGCELRLNGIGHFPIENPKLNRKNQSKKAVGAVPCVLCGGSTQTSCRICRAPLHVVKVVKGMPVSCFTKWHTDKVLEKISRGNVARNPKHRLPVPTKQEVAAKQTTPEATPVSTPVAKPPTRPVTRASE